MATRIDRQLPAELATRPFDSKCISYITCIKGSDFFTNYTSVTNTLIFLYTDRDMRSTHTKQGNMACMLGFNRDSYVVLKR